MRQQGIESRNKWDNLAKLSKLPFFKSFLILSLNNLNDIDPQQRDLIYTKIEAANFADGDINMFYLDLKKQNPTFANVTLGDAEKVRLVDTKNKLVTLSKILNQYKGKLILIDFWASWCVPCREQYPAFKKAKLNFRGQKIVFLNFSIDEDIKTAEWKKALQEEKESTSETHYRLVDWRKPLTKLLDLRTIPRYIIIDSSGKIQNTNYYVPSDLKFSEGLKSYLSTVD